MEDQTKTHSIDLSRRRLDRANFNLPCLVIVAGATVGEKLTLSKERMTIGRHRDAEVWINDESVSRRHAETRSKDGRVLLRDLGSKNGTYINDHKVLEIELKDGDLIRVGDVTLKHLGPNNIEQFYLNELSERATHDSLTGLFNKQMFNTCLQRIFLRCRELKEPLAAGIADLD